MDFAYIYIVDFDGKLVILVGKLYSCPSHGSENGKFPLKPNSNLSNLSIPKISLFQAMQSAEFSEPSKSLVSKTWCFW